MIEASGDHTGPIYLCSRCEWCPPLCTCKRAGVSARDCRRRGDAVDVEWQRERAHTVRLGRKLRGRA